MFKFAMSILIFSFQFFSSVSGQYVRITKILDSNLFQLEDGTRIKLAGIDAPGLNNSIPFFQNIAEDAVSYSTQNLLTRRVLIEPLIYDGTRNYNLVFIKYNYLFQEVNYNQKLLRNGYGKFIDNINEKYKNELIESENHARSNKEGIWEYYKSVSTDTLDKDLTAIGIMEFAKSDSVYNQDKYKPRPIYVSLPLEMLVGSISTIVTAIASGFIYSAIVQPHGEFSGLASAFFGLTVGYIIGFPSGVYLVASHDNPNLSYWTTLGSSIGLTLLTGGISAIITGENPNHFTRYIAALSPIIGPLLYVHVFPPNPPAKEKLKSMEIGEERINSFKDYYNTTINFKIELMRIYF